MKAQHKYSMENQGMQNVTMMVGLTLVVLIGGLFALMNWPAPGALPIRQNSIETSAAARPSTNRIFQDEINAAAVLDLGNSALPIYPWPERLSDMRPPTAKPISAPAAFPGRPVTTNRIFQDEINAAAVPEFGEPLLLFFSWPERLGDVRSVRAPDHGTMVTLRPATMNRFFLDEIAGVQIGN